MSRRPRKVVWVVHCHEDDGLPPFDAFSTLNAARLHAEWLRRSFGPDIRVSIHRYVRAS